MPGWFPASCQLERYPSSSSWKLGHGAHNPIPVKRTHVENPRTMLSGCREQLRWSVPESGCCTRKEEEIQCKAHYRRWQNTTLGQKQVASEM
jgi:hypothetical protein